MQLQMQDGTPIAGSCQRITQHVIEVLLEGDLPPADDLMGFRLLRDDGSLLFNSTGYDTVYREVAGGYHLSDDSSVYVPPAEPGEPAVTTPTLEELQTIKKEEVGRACEQMIYSGVSVTLPTGTEHFSLTEHDQINLFGKQAQLAAGAQQLEYHQDGQPCRYYTADEMQAILEAAMFHVSYHTTYCNSLNMWIGAVEDREELEGIFYGADIPEEYQSIVLKDYLSALAGEAGPEPGPEPEEGEGNQEEDGEIEEGN